MFGESGSSCHIRNTSEGIIDIETINEQIAGVENNTCATRKGTLKADTLCKQMDKKVLVFAILQQKYLDAPIYQAIQTMTYLQHVYPDGDTVTFDRCIKTRDGWVGEVDIKPIPGQEAEEQRALVAAQHTRAMNEYHHQIGYPNE